MKREVGHGIHAGHARPRPRTIPAGDRLRPRCGWRYCCLVSHDRQFLTLNLSRLYWPSISATERTEPLMLNSFCVNLTRSTDDPARATLALLAANPSLPSAKPTMVFLTI